MRPAVVVASRPFYRPFLYRPYFLGGYAGWYSGFGWYPHFYGPYGYPYAYPYRSYAYYTSSARLQVQPRHAEVFIDGYFAGTVDDFDGVFQRLQVRPGEHQLEIFLAGHRTYRQPILFRPGATIRIEHVMEPLGAGEPEEPRPAPSPAARQAAPARRTGVPPPPPAPSDPPIEVAPERGARSADYGALAVRVQPRDAEVLVDGERWDAPESGDLTLQLDEGSHRIEIRKDGYRTYSAEVRVRRGETTSLNVSLSRP